MAMNQHVSLGDVNYTDITAMMLKVASKGDSDDPIGLMKGQILLLSFINKKEHFKFKRSF